MEMKIVYDDGISNFLKTVVAEKPKWLGSSLKSAGFFAQKEIKKGIRSGSPGGSAYAEPMSPSKRRKIEMAFGHEPHSRYPLLGKLANAVGYDKTRASEGIVTVGWLSASAVLIGTKQEKGFLTAVTNRIRTAFAAAGYPLPPGKTSIDIKARPTYGPMRPMLQQMIPAIVEKRLAQYVSGRVERSKAKNNRRYRVYS